MWNLRRPCNAPLEADGCIPTFRCPINAQKGEPTIVSGERELFLMLLRFDVWTTLCENNEKFCMRFTTSFTHRKCVQNWPCRRWNDRRTSETSSEDVHESIMDWNLQRVYPKMRNQLRFDYANFAISDYVIQHLMGLFYVCYGKWYKDVWVWHWRDGNSVGIRSYECSLGQVDESSEKIALQALEREPIVLVNFHHWLRYAEIVLRVMCTKWWRHERRNHHVLA